MIYYIGDYLQMDFNKSYKDASFNDFKNWISSKTEVQLDTETTGLIQHSHKILCAQFGDFDTQFVIDQKYLFEVIENYNWLKEFMKNPEVLWVLHNSVFDMQFLMLKGILLGKVYDTFVVETCIKLGQPPFKMKRSLSNLADFYLGVDISKAERANIINGINSDAAIVYSALDVKYLQLIKEAQLKLADKLDILPVCRLENEYTKALSYLTLSGIKLDESAWKVRCDKDILLLEEYKKKLSEYITSNSERYWKFVDKQLDMFSTELKCLINFNSSKQVIEFFEFLGLNLLTKDKQTGKMKKSVDATVLASQVDKDPIIPIYMEYKGQEKMVSTYGYNWLQQINPNSGRIHTKYTQMVNTGRLASGGKDKWANIDYLNFLNIPQDNEVRNCIIPEQGKVFVDCDYTGQETYLFAEQANEQSMIDFLNTDGGDFHSFIASQLFEHLRDVPLMKIKNNYKQERQNSKACGFALAYGGVGATIARNANIPIEEGEALYNKYFETFKGVKAHFKRCKDSVLKLGYLVTDQVTKRRIVFPNHWKIAHYKNKFTREYWEIYRAEKQKDSIYFKTLLEEVRDLRKTEGALERASYNAPIQSCGASMIKTAAIYIFNKIVEEDALFKVLFVLQVHDQIVLECPKEQAEKWSKVVADNMVKAGNIFCKKVQIKAEPEVLTKWKK